MNVAVRELAADHPRRRFTTADVARMVEAGIMGEDERIELIDGELIEMAAKGRGHDLAKSHLARLLCRAADESLFVGVETTLSLAERVLVEPDLVVFPRTAMRERSNFIAVDGADVLLVIEVAVTSLAYDRGVKAALYGQCGVREYWVIEPILGKAWVHTRPGRDGWASIDERGPVDVLTPLAPELSGFHITPGQLT